jgi:mannobiose 2-epimerase
MNAHWLLPRNHSSLLLVALLAAFNLPGSRADTLPTHARTAHKELKEKILPYWFDTALDHTNGGYLLADDGKGHGVAKDKQIVSQARMVWTFSHVHQRGFSDEHRDYLAAAQLGYRFLTTRFFDPTNGGYFWKTDLVGRPINSCKLLYGEAFVVYALVEYHRASGEREALDRALALYRTVQERLHDDKQGGWFEHADADWRLLRPGDKRNEVEVIGYKSANAHLHWMEALAELYEVTHDRDVKKALAEALRLNMKYFNPKKPGDSCFDGKPDWKVVTAPGSTGLSYGHNVEFAWLMIRANKPWDGVPPGATSRRISTMR